MTAPLRVRAIPAGDPGSHATLAAMRRLVHQSLTDPLVIETARGIVRLDQPRDYRAHALSIRAWLAEHFLFVADPRPVELLSTPRYMIEQAARRYAVQGDCDEAATLAAALGLAVGLRAKFVALGFGDRHAPLAHVYAALGVPRMGGGWDWVALDVTRPARATPPTRIVTVEV